MMSFVATKRVHTALTAGGLLLSQLSGCYKNQTADEELIDLPGADESADGAVIAPDAGVVDARPASSCGTDAISQLFCTLLPPANTTTPMAPAATTPDLTGLLGSLGGLGNIASILGTVLGTGTTATRPTTPTTGQSGLLGLIDLAGGLGNIAALLNGLLNPQPTAQPSLADLFASLSGQQNTSEPAPALPTLADILKGLGIPVANSPVVNSEPTQQDCSKPATQAIAFVCALQSANTPK